ncbi:glutathionylspermidine synthase [Paenibacillus algicola]|uniref:Glutathionylspermidine synthase n=2 Tax=Paenibacillus algicola TaxID=2565926 RepID=A0A4V1G466_9BACL|nr:glutathionylspermidine synthase [Paenibacillus algicola]
MMNTGRHIFPLPASQQEVYGYASSDTVPYHRMYGKAYCLPSVAIYSPEEIEVLNAASQIMDQIFRKALSFAQQYLPDHYFIEQLGIPPAVLPLARQPAPTNGITRQDWILGEAGPKLIEMNADTPTGIPESAFLERHVLHHFTDFKGPSEHLAQLLKEELCAFATHGIHAGFQGPVAFSCYDWHEEDRHNTLYLMSLLEGAGIPVLYAPLEELEIIPDHGLFHKGQRIEMWYRLYPLEYLVHDRDEDNGVPVGEALLRLVQQNKLCMLNAAPHLVLQSKGFLATVWSLYERNSQTAEYCGFTLFTDQELAAIEAYCLPCYFTPQPFLQSGTDYVAKSYWGREGKGTAIMSYEDRQQPLTYAGRNVKTALEEEETEESEASEVLAYYENQPKIYQQYWSMPAASVETESGSYTGYLLTGVFIISGTFGGLLSRIGDKITGDGAYYCPAAIHPT